MVVNSTCHAGNFDNDTEDPYDSATLPLELRGRLALQRGSVPFAFSEDDRNLGIGDLHRQSLDGVSRLLVRHSLNGVSISLVP